MNFRQIIYSLVIASSLTYSILAEETHTVSLSEGIALTAERPLPVFAQSPKKTALTDDAFHFYFVGTGNPQVSMQSIRKPACQALVFDGNIWLIDAGEGASQELAKIGIPLAKVTKIFVTHLHSDHIAGIAQVINNSWIAGRSVPIEVYGPQGIQQVVEGIATEYADDIKIRQQVEMLDPKLAYVTWHTIPAHDSAQSVIKTKNLDLKAFKVDHDPAKPALGFSIDYKGVKIVFSGDTALCDSLAKNATNADVLINEAYSIPLYYKEIDHATVSHDIVRLRKLLAYHTDSWALAKMASLEKVKALIVTHLDPAIGNDIKSENEFIEGMDIYYKGPIVVAQDAAELLVSVHDNVKTIQYKQPDGKKTITL